MSDITTKTYPPSFVQAIIDEAAAETTTPEDASGMQQGDTMSDIRDALHASLDEAEAELIRTGEQLGGTRWPALRLMVEAIRQRDHEIERRLSEIETDVRELMYWR